MCKRIPCITTTLVTPFFSPSPPPLPRHLRPSCPCRSRVLPTRSPFHPSFTRMPTMLPCNILLHAHAPPFTFSPAVRPSPRSALARCPLVLSPRRRPWTWLRLTWAFVWPGLTCRTLRRYGRSEALRGPPRRYPSCTRIPFLLLSIAPISVCGRLRLHSCIPFLHPSLSQPKRPALASLCLLYPLTLP
ncbi:hypothetical protein OH77DRAFT_205682 [Trametes cingulata]|nr:hypothetical protein OH77DRAFT_205682 [Trametes cingulata]